jgi:hypothetical protein
MKRLLILGAIVSAFVSVKAQSWTNYHSSREVEINYQKAECHDIANGVHKQVMLLQFVNLTNKKLSVSFNKQMWYNGKCTGCDNPPEQHFTITLNPQQTLAGSCADKRDKSLYVVNKMLNRTSTSALTKFELSNIQISAIR